MKLYTASLAVLGALAMVGSGSRFEPLTAEQMTPEQRAVADQIMATRKNLSGPFDPWLRSPELADRLQKVGEYVRYRSSLPRALSEIAILVVARHWTCQLEWHLHYQDAVAAGVSAQVLADIAARRRPRNLDADAQLVYDFSIALHRPDAQVPDALFAAVRQRFGEKGVIDLIGINGYYDTVAMTINATRVPLPEGVRPPLR